MEKKLKIHLCMYFKKMKGIKAIKSYYEIMSSKADVNLDIAHTLLNCSKYAPIITVYV